VFNVFLSGERWRLHSCAIATRTYDEVAATQTMLDRAEERFDLRPKRLAADHCAVGSGFEDGAHALQRDSADCNERYAADFLFSFAMRGRPCGAKGICSKIVG
jgi:hypothetical protein